MKILMVLTSNDALGATGHKTGLWLEEFAAPYYTFLDAGAEVVLASPKGGRPPVDPRSDAPEMQTDATRRFHDDTDAQFQLERTAPLKDMAEEDFDGLFFPGGHGPLWDLADDADSIALIEAFVKAAKPVGAVCHGPCALLKAENADGTPLVQEKRVACFTNSEEAAVGLANVVPFSIEDEFKRLGAKFERGEDWGSFVVRDGLLVTGQNPASSQAVAVELLALLDG